MRLPAPHAPAHAPEPAHAARDPCGAPDVTAVQVPADPPTSHASHCPPQLLLQQTPSTQLPLVQSGFVVQTLPFSFGPHEPATHGLGAAHCSDPEQVIRHALPAASHVNGAHEIGDGPIHPPLPSHFESLVTLFVPGLQLAGLHTTSPHSAHRPAPSHLPVLPQLLCGSALQAGCPALGASPAANGVHTPALSGRLHALQLSVHSDWQHTPSAQNVEAQSAPEAHEPPSTVVPLIPPVPLISPGGVPPAPPSADIPASPPVPLVPPPRPASGGVSPAAPT